MSRRVQNGVRIVGAAALLLTSMFAGSATAQTTVVLDNPSRGVVDAYIRAGDYANRVYNTSVLQTKANSDMSFLRRALLKFDTENYVPENATIQSAILTVTLRSSESQTRTIGAYRVATSFDETAATWYRRKDDGSRWTASGGDLGARYATASVGTSGGTRVTFNVTALVQEAVRGNFGSRYTRIALVDAGSTSSRSLKEFHSSEASDTSLRPRLTVVYGSGSSGGGDDEDEEEDEDDPPPPPSTSSTQLKVLQWNTHYGISTNGTYSINPHIDWIVRINPDIVSLNEVEKYVGGHGNENQPALYASRLSERTGRTWYYHFAQRYGDWSSNGGGNLILSRFPILASSRLALSYDRSAALVTIEVNGRDVNFISTHLANASEGSSRRATQIRQLMSWARGFSEQRIVAGDFNAGLINVPYMEDDYNDGWMQAVAAGTETDFAGNSRPGATHDYKIDFIFESEGASRISVRSARVYDTRNSSGVRPSDHKPLLVTFNIN